MWSNDPKFDPHDLKHAHYKIVWLRFSYFTEIQTYNTLKSKDAFRHVWTLGDKGLKALFKV